jgi:hypothetical protein
LQKIIRVKDLPDLQEQRGMRGRAQTLPWGLGGGRRGKNDRKQNTLAPVVQELQWEKRGVGTWQT